jgi:cell division protein FtsB
MFSSVMTFVGYTACFWAMWKFYDTLHKKYTAKKMQSKFDCYDCMQHEANYAKLERDSNSKSHKIENMDETHDVLRENITVLQLENNSLRRNNVTLKQQIATLKKYAPTFLDFLNKASFHELTQIWGIGKVKSNKIMESRPFYAHKDIYKALNVIDIKQAQRWYQKEYGGEIGGEVNKDPKLMTVAEKLKAMRGKS